MTTTLADEWPVARKEHVCIWCGETIAKGERYRRWRGVWEGEAITNKWHKECDAAVDDATLGEGFEPHAYKRGSPEEK
jgi:hypothetical protein